MWLQLLIRPFPFPLLALFVLGGCSASTISFVTADAGGGDVQVPDPCREEEAGVFTAAAVKSNTPRANFRTRLPPRARGLVLVSSNFVQSESNGRYFQHWFGEIANLGDEPVCQVTAEVTLRSAAGVSLASLGTLVASGDPYEHVIRFPCIVPGKSGGAFASDTAPSLFLPDDVATVEVTLDGLCGSYPTPSVGVPQVLSAEIAASPTDPNSWGVTGTIEAVRDVDNVNVTVDGIDAQGLIVNHSRAFQFDPMPKGSTWTFRTQGLAYAPPFERFLLYVDFLDPDPGDAGSD